MSPKNISKWSINTWKMLNINSHYRNGNQNNNEILLHTQHNGYNQNDTLTSVGKHVGKLETSSIAGEIVKRHNHFGKQSASPQMFNVVNKQFHSLLIITQKVQINSNIH